MRTTEFYTADMIRSKIVSRFCKLALVLPSYAFLMLHIEDFSVHHYVRFLQIGSHMVNIVMG